MMHAKLLGLAVAAMAALMIFAGGASATTATSNGVAYTGTIHGSGSLSFHGSNGVTIECAGTQDWKIEVHGGLLTATGKVSSMSLAGCKSGGSGVAASVVASGSVTLHHGTSITWDGSQFEMKVSTIFGTITCVYSTSNTSVGTFTGSSTTGSNAIIDFNGTIPRTGGSGLCGNSASLTGSFNITSPFNLNLDF